MLKIARLRLLDGLMDAKFLFLFLLVLIAFVFNGIVFSVQYNVARGNYREALAVDRQGLEEASQNLQRVADFRQSFMKPPSPLAFVAEGGADRLPNTVVLNAFRRLDLTQQQGANYKLPLVTLLDWNFIVGGLMALLAISVSFGAVAGEKRNGTLRQILCNPVSRLQLFIGNYLGLLMIILLSLIVGVLVNLLTISMAGGPPFDLETLPLLGWAVILALLYLSAFLLAGLAVSAMTGRPAVALIVLLVFWVIVAVAVPGLARLLCGQFLDVPSQDEVRAEQERVSEEIEDSYPPGTFRFTGNPFDANMPKRAEAYGRMSEAEQRIYDSAVGLRVDQIYLAYRFAAVSPTGLLNDGFQTLSGTGIHGLEQLLDNAERYRKGLLDFVKSRDEMDLESAHLVYAATDTSERNTFSTKKVPASEIPGTEELWSESGLSKEHQWPFQQCLFLLLYNLAAGFIALVALLRYDPR